MTSERQSLPGCGASVCVLKAIASTFCAAIVCVTGCSERRPTTVAPDPNSPLPGETYEIVVANKSDTEIYPVLTAETFQDNLGIVGIGAESHEGFVPFKIGWEVAIAWQEGSREAPTQTTTVATASCAAKKAQIKSLEFCYRGRGEWVLTAYDSVALGAKVVDP